MNAMVLVIMLPFQPNNYKNLYISSWVWKIYGIIDI